MLKMTRKIVTLLAFAALTSGPRVQAQTSASEAFQGLPWGASVAQIQQRFPSATATTVCGNDAKDDAAWREIGRSCQAWMVRNYPVKDLSFQVLFFLSASESNLVSVSLVTHVALKADTAEARTQSLSRCDGLQALLSQRYGAGEPPWTSSSSPGIAARMKRWSPSGTVVDMNCHARGKRLSIGVGYSPAIDPAAGKL